MSTANILIAGSENNTGLSCSLLACYSRRLNKTRTHLSSRLVGRGRREESVVVNFNNTGYLRIVTTIALSPKKSSWSIFYERTKQSYISQCQYYNGNWLIQAIGG